MHKDNNESHTKFLPNSKNLAGSRFSRQRRIRIAGHLENGGVDILLLQSSLLSEAAVQPHAILTEGPMRHLSRNRQGDAAYLFPRWVEVALTQVRFVHVLRQGLRPRKERELSRVVWSTTLEASTNRRRLQTS